MFLKLEFFSQKLVDRHQTVPDNLGCSCVGVNCKLSGGVFGGGVYFLKFHSNSDIMHP